MTLLEFSEIYHPMTMRDDEYIATSGLIHCKKCHTPRQVRIESEGKIFSPRCMCQCEKEDYEKDEQMFANRRMREQIARNRSVGLPDPVLRSYTFENDLGYNPKQMSMAKKYVQNWLTVSKEALGLLLWGDVGSGKSFIAGCIANALLDTGVHVMMTNFTRLLNKLTDMYSGDRNAYIDSLNTYSLLIIDDLGVERSSDFVREQVFHIVDSRYRSQLPMIVTTNLTPEIMRNHTDLAQQRIYDRVLERCTPVCVNEQNIRKLNRDTNMARMRSIFQEVIA